MRKYLSHNFLNSETIQKWSGISDQIRKYNDAVVHKLRKCCAMGFVEKHFYSYKYPCGVIDKKKQN